MSDLIDREKAMNSVADAQNILEHIDTVYDGEINRVKRAVERILAELPTVDAVPVIRCKDCKYYRQYADGRYDCDNLYGIADAHKGCFCSRAERRKDNG